MGLSEGYVCEPCNHSLAHNLPSPKENILVNHNGRACLAGFVLLTIVAEKEAITPWVRGRGAIPWTSPELLSSKTGTHLDYRPTMESDCYALGMVIYEVLSGQAPFSSYQSLWGVARKVLDGDRPKKPEGGRGAWFTTEIWTMLEFCWKPRPADRPSSRDILWGLEKAHPPSSPCTHSDSEDSEPDVIPSGPSSTCSVSFKVSGSFSLIWLVTPHDYLSHFRTLASNSRFG